MIEIGKKIQDARKKNKLSIEQLSEKTKIRPYIISALEAGNFDVMDKVYIKSFLKTLKNELKIDDLEFPAEEKAKSKSEIIPKEPAKKESEKIFEDESHKKKIILDNTVTTSNFTNIFKKKGVKKSSNTYFFNYLIYTVFAFALVAGVYVTFMSMNSEEKAGGDDINSKKESDTTVIKENKDNLLSYFEKPDSISLVARAHDTAWMRINIDGNINREILMKPGMEEQWKAQEYFLIDQGNVGAVRYFRNGEQLQSFGMPGSVIKNVKITIDQVQNANYWKLDTAKKVNPEAASNQQKRKKKTEEPKRRIILEESNFESPTPFKKQDTKPPNFD